MHRQIPRPVASTLLLLAALGTLALEGCDNPACVFGGDCSGSGGGPGSGLGTQPATFPIDGQWIESGVPTIQRMHPSGASADPKTPIVLVFSETLAQAPPASFFELRPQGGTMPEPLAAAALVGDGRVLILRPAEDLDRGATYELLLTQSARIVDLNGQELQRPQDDRIGTFTVASSGPAVPALLTTFPLAGATFQSEVGELVVVFTRPMAAASFDDDSFGVTVEGGSPTFDPEPQPLVLVDPFPFTETRVWTWRSVDTEGDPAPLGRDAQVQLSLSPTGNPLNDTAGAALPPTLVSYRTAPFGIVSAALVSRPSDAINLENVGDAPGDPNPLDLRIDVADVMEADRIEIFLFGTSKAAPPMMPPPVISLRRDAPVGSTGASVQVDLGEAVLDLATAATPDSGRFADGSLAIALRLRRGLAGGPVVLLDVDPQAAGIQDPLFDLNPPTLLGVGASGTVLGLGRSDQPDVVLVGRASEEIRAVFVASALGDNGPDPDDPPPAVGSSASGLFVAAPIRFPGTRGVVPPAGLPLGLTVTVYDRALNPAASPTAVAWTQLGASGPDDLTSPSEIEVEVFDANTLAAVVGARVFVHVDDGVAPVLRDQDVTAAPDGRVILDRSAVPGEEVLVTVDAPGYDLFSFQGAPTSRLSIPLVPRALQDAQAAGIVVTGDNELATVQRRLSDSRRGERRPLLATVNACVFQNQSERFECPFGPLAVLPRVLGAQSALALTIPANEAQYSAAGFLLGFGLLLPAAPLAPGASGASSVALGARLSAAATPFEERALDLPPHTMDTTAYSSPPDPPVVTVEGLAPGVGGAIAVGSGVAFADGADSWRVRAAWPGVVDIVSGPGDELGRLIEQGTLEQDLFLRAEIVDLGGNRGVARPRLLARLTAPMPDTTLVPPAPSQLLAPAPSGSTGGAEYVLLFSDVLADTAGSARGLYRVELVSDVDGRRWSLWRFDPPGLGLIQGRIVVPDLGPLGGAALPAGSTRCRISAFRWESFDPSLFLWSQVGREATAASHSAEVSFTRD